MRPPDSTVVRRIEQRVASTEPTVTGRAHPCGHRSRLPTTAGRAAGRPSHVPSATARTPEGRRGGGRAVGREPPRWSGSAHRQDVALHAARGGVVVDGHRARTVSVRPAVGDVGLPPTTSATLTSAAHPGLDDRPSASSSNRRRGSPSPAPGGQYTPMPTGTAPCGRRPRRSCHSRRPAHRTKPQPSYGRRRSARRAPRCCRPDVPAAEARRLSLSRGR